MIGKPRRGTLACWCNGNPNIPLQKRKTFVIYVYVVSILIFMYFKIKAALLRHLNNNLNMFKLLKKRYCDARRRQRYINRNGSRNGN